MCLFFVMTFLANVRLEDANSWLQSTGVSLLQDLAILPFTTALAMGTMASLALCSQRVKNKIECRWLEGKNEPLQEFLQEPMPEPDEVSVKVHSAGPKKSVNQAGDGQIAFGAGTYKHFLGLKSSNRGRGSACLNMFKRSGFAHWSMRQNFAGADCYNICLCGYLQYFFVCSRTAHALPGSTFSTWISGVLGHCVGPVAALSAYSKGQTVFNASA